MDMPEVMTIEECAKYLKTSFSTLYKLAQRGKIPAFKLSGQWRFKKDIIDKWISEESLKNIKEGKDLWNM